MEFDTQEEQVVEQALWVAGAEIHGSITYTGCRGAKLTAIKLGTNVATRVRSGWQQQEVMHLVEGWEWSIEFLKFHNG